jgi:hypothetical protein
MLPTFIQYIGNKWMITRVNHAGSFKWMEGLPILSTSVGMKKRKVFCIYYRWATHLSYLLPTSHWQVSWYHTKTIIEINETLPKHNYNSEAIMESIIIFSRLPSPMSVAPAGGSGSTLALRDNATCSRLQVTIGMLSQQEHGDKC